MGVTTNYVLENIEGYKFTIMDRTEQGKPSINGQGRSFIQYGARTTWATRPKVTRAARNKKNKMAKQSRKGNR